MRAGVIDEGPLAGVRKATVSRFEHRVTSWGEAIEGWLVHEWLASHDCGWRESLTEWHNALWAADHHIRHDCGRREQASSGKYAVPKGYESDPCPLAYEEEVHEPHIYKNWEEQKTWCPGPAVFEQPSSEVSGRLTYSEHSDQAQRPFWLDAPYEPGWYIRDGYGNIQSAKVQVPQGTAYEGGMQKTPTPTHMGLPLRSEYPEQPTTAGDIYLGRDVSGQGYTEGGVAGEQGLGQGSTRGHGDGTGWWPWGGRAR